MSNLAQRSCATHRRRAMLGIARAAAGAFGAAAFVAMLFVFLGLALGPIMVLCVALGVYPQPVLDSARPDLQVVSDLIERRARSQAQASEATRQPPRVSDRGATR